MINSLFLCGAAILTLLSGHVSSHDVIFTGDRIGPDAQLRNTYQNVKFDLSVLADHISGVKLNDVKENGKDVPNGYSYHVNIGENVELDAREKELCGADLKTAGVQVLDQPNRTTSCYAMTGDIEDESTANENVVVNWLNDEAPEIGISIQYKGGSGAAGCDHERTLTYIFECAANDDVDDETLGTIMKRDNYIIEYNTCDYAILLETAFACPTSCRSKSDSGVELVCSDVGDCAWHDESKQAVCYCPPGYGGPHCEEHLKCLLPHDAPADGCGKHGTCVPIQVTPYNNTAVDPNNPYAKCACTDGYGGKYCQTASPCAGPATWNFIFLLVIFGLFGSLYYMHRNANGLPLNPFAGGGSGGFSGFSGGRGGGNYASGKYADLESSADLGGYEAPTENTAASI
eukprot:g3937.t1